MKKLAQVLVEQNLSKYVYKNKTSGTD